MPRAATSRDVARLAGVAQSTVSYVLSGKGSISESTRERVLRAAAELNYRPNLAARSMRTGRTGRLAVLVPILVYNPIRLLAGASAVAEGAGYALEVHSVLGDRAERIRRLHEIVDSGRFEGVLVVSQLAADEVPPHRGTVVVALAEFDDELHGAGELANPQPIAELVEGLANAGHRRFLHISGDLDYPSARARQRTYSEAIERLGLESIGVARGDWSGRCGEEAIDALPPGVPPLAVIAANDVSAAGAMRAALRRGWSIPGQLVVSGWDNIAMGEYLWPSLTTVNIDYDRLGRRSMRRLLAAIHNEPLDHDDRPLQHVVWRESTGAAGPR